jgi:hypothetical protein
MRIRLEEHDRAKSSDGAGEELGEGAVVRGEKETAAEAVLEKSKGSDR